MRVLALGNMYPPHHLGGYELVWRSAVEHLRAQGHAVRVLCSDHREATADPDDPDVHRELGWYWRDHRFPGLSPRARLDLQRRNAEVLDRHLADLRPEVVTWWSMGGMTLSLIERIRRSGLPSVAFVHDDWLLYGPRVDAWLRSFERHQMVGGAVERATGIPTRVRFGAAATFVFVSEFTRRRALGALHLPRTAVAHSGIEEAFLHPAPEPRRWGWRLLYVGRVDPRKGIDTAVDALATLPPAATLRVVGPGDPRECTRVQRRAAALGLGDRVELLGARDRAQLPGLYAQADAVVFPVRWEEPWGLVPLEAMALGRPVVATGRGGSAEYLRDEDNCLLFEAGDGPGLGNAVRRLAGDRPLRARLRQAGLRTAVAHTEAAFNAAAASHLEAAAASGGAPRPTAIAAARARRPGRRRGRSGDL